MRAPTPPIIRQRILLATPRPKGTRIVLGRVLSYFFIVVVRQCALPSCTPAAGRSGSSRPRAGKLACSLPVLPRYVARTVRLRLVRVPSTYSTWGPGGERPCASGTFTTREAGTHGLYVPYGGPRLYLSTQFSASPHTSRPAMRASSEAESTGSACGRAPCAGMTIEQHDEAHATHEACSVPSTVESR